MILCYYNYRKCLYVLGGEIMDFKKITKVFKVFDEEFNKKDFEKKNKSEGLSLQEKWDIDSEENSLHFSDE